MQITHWTRLKDEVRFLTTKCTDMFASIHAAIVNTSCETHQETLNKLITDYKTIIPTEKSRIKDLADEIRQHLAFIWLDIDSKSDVNGITVQLYLIQDDIVKVKKLIADAIQNWNHKLQELVSQQKKYSKQARKEATPPPPSEDDSKLGTSASSQHSEILDSQSLTSTSEFTEVDIPPVLDPYGRVPSMPVRINDAVEANFKETSESLSDFILVQEDYALSTESNQYSVTPGIDAGILEDAEKLRSKSGDTTQYVVVHFPEDAGEVDKESTKLDVADMMTSQEVEGTSSKDQIKPSSSKSNLKKTGPSDDILDGHKMDRITNIKSRVTNFLGGSSIPNTLKVNYDEHHQLPAGKVPVLIYEDEPSSIIAYTLGSQEYFAKLQEIQASITQRDSTQNKEFKFGKSGEHDMASAESSETGRKHGSGVLSFLRGSNSRDTSPKPHRKQEYVDTVKYTPKIDLDSVEIDLESAKIGKTSNNSRSMYVRLPVYLKSCFHFFFWSIHISL
nr:uncharacterized protein LOC117680660 [Crassostrea gigas]